MWFPFATPYGFNSRDSEVSFSNDPSYWGSYSGEKGLGKSDATLHQSQFYGRVAKRKPLLSESLLGVCKKKHLKDSQTVRNKILWFD